ncbi:MAG TPA: hypothetical protein VNA14_11275 [Mycobacteriales bacterium]|nr:hypothetical protein [Mycobacteriales bacterium]
MADISFELHFGTDVAVADVVERLQEALLELAPSFCKRLRVLEYEGDRAREDVDATTPGALHAAVVRKGTARGALFDKLVATSPPELSRRFGTVLVRGAAPSTFFTIGFDEHVPARRAGESWLFSNNISGRIGAKRIGKLSPDAWVQGLLRGFAVHPDLLWAMACVEDEFAYHNVREDDVRIHVFGRDVRLSLPGIYWLNVFGPPYAALIGHDVLASAPAVAADRVGDAAVVQLYEEPDEWSTDEGRARRRQVLARLGGKFFFDRTNPDARTVAPDFGLSPLSEGGSLTVTTQDGHTWQQVD